MMKKSNSRTSQPDRAGTLKSPTQKRSRETLQKIMDAATQLLKDKRFSEISIQEIATTAGCGVGTVYGRFKNKSALLALLEDEVLADIFQRQDAFLTETSWTGVSFEARTKKLIAHILAGYKRHGMVLRELVSRVHLQIDRPNIYLHY